MSIEAGKWAWGQELPTHLKLTLVALAEWADPTGYCWPEVATIADRVGAAESTARRHLSELVDLGLLEKVKRRRGPEGGLRGWEYQLNLALTGERKDEDPTAHGRANLPLTGERSYEPPLEPPDTPLPSADADGQEIEASTNGFPLSHTEAFEALADACGYDAEAIRKVGGGLIGRNAKVLRESGATREEIIARAGRYRATHPEWELTPASLVKWWPTLQPPEGHEDRTCECGQPTGRQHDDLAHGLLLS